MLSPICLHFLAGLAGIPVSAREALKIYIIRNKGRLLNYSYAQSKSSAFKEYARFMLNPKFSNIFNEYP